MRDPGLEEAVRAVGGVSELARQIGISQPSVSNWNRVPAERVLIVEAATGVDRKVLRPDLYGEPGKASQRPTMSTAARAQEYALLATLLARAPDAELLASLARLARRRHAARCRACRAGAGRQRNHGRARRARVSSISSSGSAAANCCPTPRTISPASCTSVRWRGCARDLGAARHRARRRQLRARGSCRDPVRDHGGPGRAAACRRRRAPISRFSRSIWRPGSGASLPIWNGPKPPISIAESARSAGCSWKSKRKPLRCRHETAREPTARRKCDERTRQNKTNRSAVVTSFARSAPAPVSRRPPRRRSRPWPRRTARTTMKSARPATRKPIT